MAAIFRRRWPRTPVVRAPTRRFVPGKEQPHFTTARVAIGTVPLMTCGGWNPATLPNVYEGWDASDTSRITNVGGFASQMDGQLALGFIGNFVQVVAANRPATGSRTINGRNVLDFDGVNDAMGASLSAVHSQPQTYYLVYQSDSTADFGRILDSSNASDGTRQLYDVAFGGNRVMFAGAAQNFGTATTNLESAVLYFNGASSEVFINGVSQGVHDVGSGAAGTIALSLILGSDSAGGGGVEFDGAFCEMWAQSGLGTATDRTNWESYVAAKWRGQACSVTQRKPTARNDLTLLGAGIPLHVVAFNKVGLSLAAAVGYAPARKAVTRVGHNPVAPVAYAPDRKGARPVGYSPAAVPGYAPAKTARNDTARAFPGTLGYGPAKSARTAVARVDALAVALAPVQKAVTRVARVDASLLAWPSVSRVATVFEIGSLFLAGVGVAPVKAARAALGRGDAAVLPYSAARKAVTRAARADAVPVAYAPARKNTPAAAPLPVGLDARALDKTARADLARVFAAVPGVAFERKAVTRTGRVDASLLAWPNVSRLTTVFEIGQVYVGAFGAGALRTTKATPSARSDLGAFARAQPSTARAVSARSDTPAFGRTLDTTARLVVARADGTALPYAPARTARAALARGFAGVPGSSAVRKAITRTARGDIAVVQIATLFPNRNAFAHLGAVGYAGTRGAHAPLGRADVGIVAYALSVTARAAVARSDVAAFARGITRRGYLVFGSTPVSVNGRTPTTPTVHKPLARADVAPVGFAVLRKAVARTGRTDLAVHGFGTLKTERSGLGAVGLVGYAPATTGRRDTGYTALGVAAYATRLIDRRPAATVGVGLTARAGSAKTVRAVLALLRAGVRGQAGSLKTFRATRALVVLDADGRVTSVFITGQTKPGGGVTTSVRPGAGVTSDVTPGGPSGDVTLRRRPGVTGGLR